MNILGIELQDNLDLFVKNTNKGLKNQDFFNSLPEVKDIECSKHGVYKASKVCLIFDTAKYSYCPKCELEKKLEKEKEEIELKAQQKEINKELFLRELQNRGVNSVFLQKRDKLDYGIGVIKDLKNLLCLNAKKDDFEINSSLLIFGGCGIGKSFFSYKLIEIGFVLRKRIVSYKMRQLVSIYKSYTLENGFTRTNSYENLETILNSVDTLIIDEIDDCLSDKASIEVIKYIVAICYDKAQRVVIVGNCNDKEFFNHLEPKTVSRLKTFKSFVFGNNFKDLR